MDLQILLTIFTSIAMVSCLFMTTYFIGVRKEHKIKDLSLGLLFLAIAFRISKSMFANVLVDFSYLLIAFGLLGVAVMGPLILIYFQFSKDDNITLNSKYLLHLIFPAISFIIMLIPGRSAWSIYFIATISFGLYLGVIGYMFVYNKNKKRNLTKWHNELYYGMIGLFSIFLLQMIIGSAISYVTGVVLTSFIIYALFFLALRSPILIRKSVSTYLPKEMLDTIVKTIEIDKIYLQPAMTLSQFSEVINTPTYLISKAIKLIYNKNFPEVINSFRIKEIKEKLSDVDYVNEKIEDLAYNVGFKTSSAFYLAFKKETSMSPRAYQRKKLNKLIED